MLRWVFRLGAVLLLGWGLGFIAFMLTLPRPAPSRLHTDAIVVLTGGPGRIVRGLDLIRGGAAKRMLISGVEPSVQPEELALTNGVSPRWFACCVDLDRQAVDTRSNALETWRWLKDHEFRSVRLVTTDWHMRRAEFELRQAADGPLVVLADAVPSEASLGIYFREYNKFVLRLAAAGVGL